MHRNNDKLNGFYLVLKEQSLFPSKTGCYNVQASLQRKVKVSDYTMHVHSTTYANYQTKLLCSDGQYNGLNRPKDLCTLIKFIFPSVSVRRMCTVSA